MNNVLIIDDEERLRKLLVRILELEGYHVCEADSCKAGLKKMEQHHPEVVLCDVRLPDGDGIELVKQIKTKFPVSEIILLTAHGNIADGVLAIKNGAFDYITKGDDNIKILPLIQRAFEKVTLSLRIQQLEQQVNAHRFTFDKILGHSKSIQQAIELAEKVAVTDTTVLLTGETGTGKEVFAQAIHSGSKRSSKPFVAINCAAFTRDLLESELFGHKAGSFTGALKDKKGLFEEANSGTIFLDEIGEMPQELQAKLLRVLETGEFNKVGDSKITKVNARIISATNRDLQKQISDGYFREDLFYRLSAFQISLPSLKDRKSDIELLAGNFVTRYTLKINKPIEGIELAYLEILKNYSWPGNIRELKNVVERSIILTDGKNLSAASLPFEMHTGKESGNEHTLSAFSLASVEKLHIQKVLNHTGGNKTETARLLGIGLTTLYRKIEEFRL